MHVWQRTPGLSPQPHFKYSYLFWTITVPRCTYLSRTVFLGVIAEQPLAQLHVAVVNRRNQKK